MTAIPASNLTDETAPRHRLRTRTIRWLLAGIVIFAFLARMAAVVLLQAWNHPSSMEHGAIAKNFIATGSFSFGVFGYFGPSSVQSPPYPFLMILLYKTFGIESFGAFLTAMTLNAVLGAASVYYLYHLVRLLRGGPITALLAASLLAIWPTQVYSATVAQAICLIVFCTICAIVHFYRAVDSGQLAPWVIFSVVGCVGSLTEPILLPFMMLSGVMILFWKSLPVVARFRNAWILLLTALTIFGPWTLRNYLVHGQFVAVKGQFWWNLYKTSNPHATGSDRAEPTPEMRAELAKLTPAERRNSKHDHMHQFDLLTYEQQVELSEKTEIQREEITGRWTKKWISENPKQFAWITLMRVKKTLWYDDDNPQVDRIYLTSRTILLVGFPVGLILAWRRGYRLLIPVLVLGVALSIHAITIAAARFIFPHEPFQIAMLAVVIVTTLGATGLLRRSLVESEFPPRPVADGDAR
jgi:4-amino-4-deoxy-L-arabinose transferase-like glycosyltransferase